MPDGFKPKGITVYLGVKQLRYMGQSSGVTFSLLISFVGFQRLLVPHCHDGNFELD
jgi:hypothetical protein